MSTYAAQTAALTLASTINRYWAERGHPDVEAVVVPWYWTDESGTEQHAGYAIKSNLVNGLPPSQQAAIVRRRKATPRAKGFDFVTGEHL
jgi:hypothetical protein